MSVLVALARLEDGKRDGRGGVEVEVVLALVFLDVPAVPLCNSGARKIAAKHDDLWNEIVFDAVVKDLLKTSQRVRLVQPNVRKEKKVHIREISLDSEGILSLHGYFCERRGDTRQPPSTYVLQRRCRSFT